MIELNITEEQLAAIRAKLAKFPEAITPAIEDAAQTLRNLVIGRTPVGDPGYDPHWGQLKRSWSDVKRVSGGFSFSTDVPYSVTLEEGLYTTVGPRTIATGEGIFSRQAPEGILKPLVEDEFILNLIVESVAEQLLKGLEGA